MVHVLKCSPPCVEMSAGRAIISFLKTLRNCGQLGKKQRGKDHDQGRVDMQYKKSKITDKINTVLGWMKSATRGEAIVSSPLFWAAFSFVH